MLNEIPKEAFQDKIQEEFPERIQGQKEKLLRTRNARRIPYLTSYGNIHVNNKGRSSRSGLFRGEKYAML